jgi:hypothetical protein
MARERLLGALQLQTADSHRAHGRMALRVMRGGAIGRPADNMRRFLSAISWRRFLQNVVSKLFPAPFELDFDKLPLNIKALEREYVEVCG